jgi:Zn-dependent peptidase ImmA (M78 family)
VPTVKVPLKPETLAWAMKRTRLEPDVLAKAAGVRPEKVAAWLQGNERPTYRQARELANRLHISFSQLILPPPDRIELPVQDFRRGSARGREPTPELIDALYDALRKRDWYREYRLEAPLPFAGSRSWRQHHPESVAEAIREMVPVQDLQGATPSWGEFLKQFVENVEQSGVLVLRQGYAGSNTRRVYDPQEFSGFAIADQGAPVVFLNARDSVARQVFTLAHELAHVWLGESALDDVLEADADPKEHVERFCDQVAAIVLMPEESFSDAWEGEPYESAQRAAKRFKVSAWAALRRARELELVGFKEYQTALERIQDVTKEREEREGGGNFWATLKARNSATFTRAVAESALRGELSAKEVASLLNLRLATALEFLDRAASVPA